MRGTGDDRSRPSRATFVENSEATVEDLRFHLSLPEGGIRINQSASIRLSVEKSDHSPLELQEVMGASAHLVAFDSDRSGFAHLHPIEDASPVSTPDASQPRDLSFSLYLTDPGPYRLWAQVKVDGRERYAPFDFTVVP
jgi:hypothetical protein